MKNITSNKLTVILLATFAPIMLALSSKVPEAEPDPDQDQEWTVEYRVLAIEDVDHTFGAEKVSVRYVLRRFESYRAVPDSDLLWRGRSGHVITAINMGLKTDPYVLWVCPPNLVNIREARGGVNERLGDLKWSDTENSLLCAFALSTSNQASVVTQRYSLEYNPVDGTVKVAAFSGLQQQLSGFALSGPHSKLEILDVEDGRLRFALKAANEPEQQGEWKVTAATSRPSSVAHSEAAAAQTVDLLWSSLRAVAEEDATLSTKQ